MPSFQHLHTLRYKLRSFLLTHRGRPKWMHFFSTGHTEMDAHVTKTFCGFVAGLTEMEQNFSARTARMCKVDTGVTQASSVSRSPGGSSPSLEQVDCSTATWSRYQGSSNENRNTRRRLDTDKSPDDENARSAVLTTRYLTRLQSVCCLETCLIQEPKVQIFLFYGETSDLDDLGRIIRSPDALRPLT